jgi:pSer/pThr/pTyr-binding forkhead associated (FHA) protein
VNALIRFITRTAAGSVEQHDKIVEAAAITIGRATDQVLHLRDKRARLQHAQIERKAGEVRITSGALAGVTVNGRSQRDVKLDVGDVIEVGANIIRVIDAPEGVDVAISFELSNDASAEHYEADWSAPAVGIGGWNKRRLSWVSVAAVLALAVALPAVVLLGPGPAGFMRGSPLPDDSWWLAGPIHRGHSTIGDECEVCHVSAFQRVPDAACVECHEASRHVADDEHAVLGETRCASCHLEHNEPAQLVKRHQGLCADCHNDLPAGIELQPASDFLDAHPDSKVSLKLSETNDDGETEWVITHLRLADAQGGDRSNLTFNHKVHLDPDGIVTPDGNRVIECAECHVPEPGGALMKPIAMDEHCSGCHTLSFDPDDPSRSVPHGEPAAVVQALIEFYSARLLGDDPGAVEQRLRRPGQRLSREDRDRVAAEAREQAMAVAADLFERRACATCHEVTRSDGDLPWHVRPVQLTAYFYPHANFTHAAHDTEVTDCDGCHNASASETSRDVLIPDIDTCRECHGSGIARRNNASQLPSACIMCHNFHFAAKGTYP